jgi:hypothetical protein
MGELFESPLAFECIILAYVGLNVAEKALDATIAYISCFGRVTWPVRSALRKLNVNADALYVQHCGHAV